MHCMGGGGRFLSSALKNLCMHKLRVNPLDYLMAKGYKDGVPICAHL